jgi:hypothetical protein
VTRFAIVFCTAAMLVSLAALGLTISIVAAPHYLCFTVLDAGY